MRTVLLAAFAAIGFSANAQMIVPDSIAVSPIGALIYSMPIQVPPGIGVIEPKLALSYSSQSGVGLAGIGWSIAGLSSISRCLQTVAQDTGVLPNGMVNFTSSDRFCIDGKRLMALNGRSRRCYRLGTPPDQAEPPVLGQSSVLEERSAGTQSV